MLDVPISFFFDDMPEPLATAYGGQTGLTGRRTRASPRRRTASATTTLNRRETLELVRAYYRITDPAVRKRVFELIKSLAPRTPFENSV